MSIAVVAQAVSFRGLVRQVEVDVLTGQESQAAIAAAGSGGAVPQSLRRRQRGAIRWR